MLEWKLLSLVQLLTVSSFLTGCHAGVFYCPSEGPLTIGIDRQPRLEDFIVPEIDRDRRTDLPIIFRRGSSDGGGGGVGCIWKLTLHGETSRQIVVEGISKSLLNDNQPQMPPTQASTTYDADAAEVTCEISQDNSVCPQLRVANIRLGFFNVISLPPGGHLTLTTSGPIESSPVAVKIALIDEGYCAKDMVSYDSNCLHLTAQNMTLNESLNIIQQAGTAGMRLASFDSVGDILRFVGSNRSPIGVFPIKTPLHLSEPVRIGLYRSSQTGQVGHLSKIAGKCGVEMATNLTEILSLTGEISGECGSLRVTESGRPVIDFVDCNRRMRALISFPEASRTSENCTNCSSHRVIRHWLQGSGIADDDFPWYRRLGIMEIVVAVVAATVALLLCLSLGIGLWSLRRRRQRRGAKARQAEAGNSPLIPQL